MSLMGTGLIQEQAERLAAEPRRVKERLASSAQHLPAVGSSGWFGEVPSARLTGKLGTMPNRNDPDRVIFHAVEEAARSDDDLPVR